MIVRRFEELQPQPWRNGGGITREIMYLPEQDDFAARVSIADVGESGPFSRFDGVDRIIMLLDGPGMRLESQAGLVDLRQHEPYTFDGGEPVRGVITTPTRDLNVMTRRGVASADLRVQPEGAVSDNEVGRPQIVAVALADGVTVAAAGEPAMRLGRWDSAIRHTPTVLHVTGHAAIITIRMAR